MRNYCLKIYLVVILLCVFVTIGFAQAPDTLWTRTYGGLKLEEAYSVLETSDGGFILVGYTTSFGEGGADVYLIKTDSNGNVLWTHTYGGRYSDYGRCIKKALSGGGYIIAGHTTSFGAGRHDVYLLRIDDNGDTLWTRTYGGPDWDIAYSVEPTPDSGFIVTGKTYSFGAGMFDVYIIKTDADGNAIWTRTCGGTGDDIGYDVQIDPYGYPGYVIVGSRYWLETQTSNIYLIKTNFEGDTLWTKTYGGTCAEGHSLIITPGGEYYDHYIITGTVVSPFPSFYQSKIFILKVDSPDGNPWWFKTYGEELEEYNSSEGFSIYKTPQNEYVVTGWTYGVDSSFNAYEGVYVFKTSQSGDLLWKEIIEGPGINFGYDIQQTSDDGYIIVGRAESYPRATDIYLIKLASEFGVTEATEYNAPQFSISIFPNPFGDKVNITLSSVHGAKGKELKIYDISGRVVKNFSLPTTYSLLPTSIMWDGCDNAGKKLPSGTYLLKFSADNYEEIKKLVLLR